MNYEFLSLYQTFRLYNPQRSPLSTSAATITYYKIVIFPLGQFMKFHLVLPQISTRLKQT